MRFSEIISIRQQTTLDTGKPLLYLDIDTLPHTDVTGPKLLTRNDDMARNLSEDNPVIKEPVSKVLRRDAVMDEDLPTQLTKREGVSTRIERMTKGEGMPADQEPQKCSHTKAGRCRIHGEGAKKVPMMVKQTVVGEGGTKTTKSVKRYIWRCDINKRGVKMIQSNIYLSSLGRNQRRHFYSASGRCF